MDAVKFIEEQKRLCGTYEICKDCPANRNPGCLFNLNYGDDADEQVSFLEEWSAAHPRKTRQSVFLEHFPSVKLDRNGIIDMLPCRLDQKHYPFNGDKCAQFQACSACRREFWMQEVE